METADGIEISASLAEGKFLFGRLLSVGNLFCPLPREGMELALQGRHTKKRARAIKILPAPLFPHYLHLVGLTRISPRRHTHSSSQLCPVYIAIRSVIDINYYICLMASSTIHMRCVVATQALNNRLITLKYIWFNVNIVPAISASCCVGSQAINRWRPWSLKSPSEMSDSRCCCCQTIKINGVRMAGSAMMHTRFVLKVHCNGVRNAVPRKSSGRNNSNPPPSP